MIAIVDYGLGNIGSVKNMLKRLGIASQITRDPSQILDADKIIIPGVGAFDYGMEQLHKLKLSDILNEAVVIKKKPCLGICLGAQLMTLESEEGEKKGLGWIDAKTIRFNQNILQDNLKIPHMGWAEVKTKNDSVLFKNIDDIPRFYFVHSYHFNTTANELVIATANYGYEFACALAYKNIFAIQFHPEKSHKFGMQLLKNFVTAL